MTQDIYIYIYIYIVAKSEAKKMKGEKPCFFFKRKEERITDRIFQRLNRLCVFFLIRSILNFMNIVHASNHT